MRALLFALLVATAQGVCVPKSCTKESIVGVAWPTTFDNLDLGCVVSTIRECKDVVSQLPAFLEFNLCNVALESVLRPVPFTSLLNRLTTDDSDVSLLCVEMVFRLLHETTEARRLVQSARTVDDGTGH